MLNLVNKQVNTQKLKTLRGQPTKVTARCFLSLGMFLSTEEELIMSVACHFVTLASCLCAFLTFLVLYYCSKVSICLQFIKIFIPNLLFESKENWLLL